MGFDGASGKYATREREVDDLLRNQVFVDLYTIVRQGLIVGTPSYSLKDVEKLYLEARGGEVTTAGGSVVAYHNWMQSQQSQNWRESPILKEIRDYNEVDCVSTWKLADWLRQLQKEQGISHLPKESDSNKANSTATEEPVHPATQLSLTLLAQAEAAETTDLEELRIQKLLAWLLEFHWREDKPVFWRMFDWHEKTDQELTEDFDCLGELKRTTKPPEPIKRSRLVEYAFDPSQETKLHEGSRCFFSHDLGLSTTIESLDRAAGLVGLKLGPKIDQIPESLSLIPDEHVSSRGIAEAVYRYVEAWSRGSSLSCAVDDLIHRRPPRLKGQKEGELIPQTTDLLTGTVDVIQRMDHTVLCIQGPPGTGKTYTAAQAILRLLQDGNRIAVTSNSHKAIMNVLRAVHEVMEKEGAHFDLIKVGGDGDDPLIDSGEIQHLSQGKDAEAIPMNQPLVTGGTAWVFSRPALEGTYDYLFVDEAGQFSLANTVATGLCATNLVLVGDQMQLSQPTLGSHPGESGQSALEYLLDGRTTIPPDFGIFLNQTWRMHPAICEFISNAIYEGRLKSHPKTSQQYVETLGQHSGLINQAAGIIFVPVKHEGNTQRSDEEVDAIEKIVTELLGRSVSKFGGERGSELTLQDILIVAPFNMQVRALQQRLGEQARVGSVDKFQGQEAEVVIISMCSSTLEDSPRGAEFLLEPNRINVAVSRARCLTIVVGSPDLRSARCQTINDMKLVNLFCWLVEHASLPELETERGVYDVIHQQ